MGRRCRPGRHHELKNPRRTTRANAVTGIAPARPEWCRPFNRGLVTTMLTALLDWCFALCDVRDRVRPSGDLLVPTLRARLCVEP
jgi:hypothetical protein